MSPRQFVGSVVDEKANDFDVSVLRSKMQGRVRIFVLFIQSFIVGEAQNLVNTSTKQAKKKL